MFGDIRNKQGERLDYTFHQAANKDGKCIVVIGHGVTGNKDRPFVVALAEAFAKAGIHALRLSFSGNGASEGKFTESNISKEVEDLGSALDALANYNVCYVGHSMGGAVGVLRASKDPRIKMLVSLAGMVHTKDFAAREFGAVKPGEGLMWDKPDCPLSQAFMDDLNGLDTLKELGAKIKVPWLLVHGVTDDVVPLQDSLDIYGKGRAEHHLVQLDGADHVFSEGHTQTMVEVVVDWVARRMTPEWCAQAR
ncbi:MAG TPA: alpha/beta fold hydrolase [Methylomirabilota bacterium]|nr:alpha/beta fold hydrolase [Methylomirabilota bacterium]